MPFRTCEAKKQLKQLKKKWVELQKTPDVFAYTLNVTNKKYLSCKKTFFIELNEERSTLRRAPQTITTLNPPFDENSFNFKKINPLEVMSKIQFGAKDVAMIINKSPLTKYHTLICPDLEAGLGQRLTPASLEFSVKFLRDINKPKYRIGYNSPGALASVNHLHLHLVRIPSLIYIDNCKLENLADDYIYRLSKDMPTEAICFVINKKEKDEIMNKKLNEINKFIDWLCEQNYPHNLFITIGRKGEHKNKLKVFVFARKDYCIVKDLQSFNVGFCELSGYVPVGGQQLYNTLTDEQIIAKICTETGDVYGRIYEYFNNLVVNKVIPDATTNTKTMQKSAPAGLNESLKSSAPTGKSKGADDHPTTTNAMRNNKMIAASN